MTLSVQEEGHWLKIAVACGLARVVPRTGKGRGRCGAVARLVAIETREEQGNLGSGDDTDTKS